MNPRPLAATCTAVVLLANIAVEHVLMGVQHGVTIIPGLADFHPAWNRGVSFSLLTQNTDSGRYLLIAGLAVLILAVAVMAWRSTSWWSAAGYGLILGGALGNNLIDRVFYGGVFDFLYLHLGAMPLFVCNFADIAISAGVVLLLAESVLAKPRSTSGPSQP